MEERLTNIELQLEGMKSLLVKLNDNIEKINKKLDDLDESIDEELLPECRKMGSHIDFVENVYDTVKHPLGYLCNKIKGITGRNQEYSLTNISNSDVADLEEETVNLENENEDL